MASEDYSGTEVSLRIATGAGVNFTGTILKSFFAFAFSLLISRVLSVSDLGLYTMGTTIAFLSVFACTLGLDVGLWRYIALFRAQDDEERLRGAFKGAFAVAFPLSVLAAVLLTVFAPAISQLFFESDEFTTALRAFAITIPMLVSARLFNAATQGMQIMRYAAIRDIVEQGLRLSFTALLFILGMRMAGALAANILAVLLITLMSLYFLEKTHSMLKRTRKHVFQIRRLVSYSAPLGPSLVMTYAIIWMDTLFLGFFGTSDDVGLYSVAIRVIIMASVVQASFSTMFAPVISDLYVRHEHDQLADLFKKVTRWTVLLSLPLLMPLLMFSSQVLGVFGEQFQVISASLVIVTLGQAVNALTGPVGMMVAMTGRSRLELLNSFATLVVSVTLCVVLIPRYGIMGAAITNAISAFTGNAIRTLEVYFLLDMQPYSLRYLKLAAAAVAASGLAYAGFRLLPLGYGIESLLLWSMALIALYATVLLALGFEKDDSEVFQLLKTRLARARAA